MPIVIALISGALFGAGLTIAQMVNPQKILNFFDFAAIPIGGWDPTLLFVFAGALPVMFAAYAVQRRIAKPLCEVAYTDLVQKDVDANLVLGSAIFGVGWGLVGFCPGPAIAALPLVKTGTLDVVLYVAALISGVMLSIIWKSRLGGHAVRPAT